MRKKTRKRHRSDPGLWLPFNLKKKVSQELLLGRSNISSARSTPLYLVRIQEPPNLRSVPNVTDVAEKSSHSHAWLVNRLVNRRADTRSGHAGELKEMPVCLAYSIRTVGSHRWRGRKEWSQMKKESLTHEQHEPMIAEENDQKTSSLSHQPIRSTCTDVCTYLYLASLSGK